MGSERFPVHIYEDAENALSKSKETTESCRKGSMMSVGSIGVLPDTEANTLFTRTIIRTQFSLGIYRDHSIAFNFQSALTAKKVACEWRSTLLFMFMECMLEQDMQR
jgi:hypothetical protein